MDYIPAAVCGCFLTTRSTDFMSAGYYGRYMTNTYDFLVYMCSWIVLLVLESSHLLQM